MICKSKPARRLRVIFLSAATFLAVYVALPLGAQQAVVPAGSVADSKAANGLDSILAALDANIADYDRSTPSFLCNEHVLSQLEPNSTTFGAQRTVVDSVFRVRRSIGADRRVAFVESRTVKTIDGKPPAAVTGDETTETAGPMAVFGIFSNGLALVTSQASVCFRYRVRPPRKNHPADKIVINFDSLPPSERAAACLYWDKTSGRAFVNPSNLRVVRVETHVKDYEMRPGDKEAWDWSIDYSPVILGGKTFWMPATIKSRAVPNESTSTTGPVPSGGRRGAGTTLGSTSSNPVTYTLDARYTDYHLLNVTSRIITDLGPDDPTPPEATPDATQPVPTPDPVPQDAAPAAETPPNL